MADLTHERCIVPIAAHMRRQLAWHEAGHAVISALLFPELPFAIHKANRVAINGPFLGAPPPVFASFKSIPMAVPAYLDELPREMGMLAYECYWPSKFEAAAVAIAGCAGSLLGGFQDNPTWARNDRSILRGSLAEANLSHCARKVWIFVWHTLRRYRPALRAIAEQLTDQEAMSSNEVKALMQAYRVSRPGIFNKEATHE